MNCKYCNKECKNLNSLHQHEIRCQLNPNKIESGNKGHMPIHTKNYYSKLVKIKSGAILDINNKQLEDYRNSHLVCEICGKTINEVTKWNSKFAPKKLCIDHDHNTNKFRGLLCSVCNRQLGWYEKYRDEINNYLNK